MKRIILNCLVIGAAFLLFIIWYEKFIKEDSLIPVTNPLEDRKVYLITMDKESEFWYSMDEGARDMARLIRLNYIWSAPEERDVEEQIRLFREAVESGADAILLAASDPEAISDSVAEAKERGVKIIYVDAPAPEKAVITLATDNYQAGRIAGEKMIEELESIGIQNGSIGVIGVTPVNITTRNRELGFRDVIERDGRFELLETGYTNGNEIAAKEATESYIEDHPDLVGIFSTNEDSTLGLGMALNEVDKRIIGIGFDITKEILEMIDNGILQGVLIQNPYTMGYLGMAEAFAALQGYETGPKVIDTGVSVIDRFTPRYLLPKFN